MHLQTVPSGVEEVQRVSFGPVLLPQFHTVRLRSLDDRRKFFGARVQSDVRVVGCESGLVGSVDERDPEVAREEIGAFRPLGENPTPEHFHIELDASVDKRRRERYVVDSPESHDAMVALDDGARNGVEPGAEARRPSRTRLRIATNVKMRCRTCPIPPDRRRLGDTR